MKVGRPTIINRPKDWTEEHEPWKSRRRGEYMCPRCGHVWIPKVDSPKNCPDCDWRLDWE